MSKKLEERSKLVSAMMDRCGADAAESFRQGVIGPRQYRECLERCAQCAKTATCVRLLAEDPARPRYDINYADNDAPEYCRNKAQIADQKDRLRRALS
ncbi:MAG: DUF6455 family protein [Neomegalonema sp.]|nr:DUF6455 family protein [Neomegalonema sp.]